jgi:hypothetical protein
MKIFFPANLVSPVFSTATLAFHPLGAPNLGEVLQGTPRASRAGVRAYVFHNTIMVNLLMLVRAFFFDLFPPILTAATLAFH